VVGADPMGRMASFCTVVFYDSMNSPLPSPTGRMGGVVDGLPRGWVEVRSIKTFKVGGSWINTRGRK